MLRRNRCAAQTGEALIEQVDMVMFTGSTRTGRGREARRADADPGSLELGGKDPMIVLADADVERAANVATFYAMKNAGQICISVERVYVEEPIYDEFVAKVLEKVRAPARGRARGAPARSRSVRSRPAADRDDRGPRRGRPRRRARECSPAASRRPGAGRFYEPTVLVDVDHSMKCMTEETFGPTLPIMKVADDEEAIRLANDSPVRARARRSSRATPSAARRSRDGSRRAR